MSIDFLVGQSFDSVHNNVGIGNALLCRAISAFSGYRPARSHRLQATAKTSVRFATSPRVMLPLIAGSVQPAVVDFCMDVPQDMHQTFLDIEQFGVRRIKQQLSGC